MISGGMRRERRSMMWIIEEVRGKAVFGEEKEKTKERNALCALVGD